VQQDCIIVQQCFDLLQACFCLQLLTAIHCTSSPLQGVKLSIRGVDCNRSRPVEDTGRPTTPQLHTCPTLLMVLLVVITVEVYVL
jgi:hypothetical protein